MQKKQKNYMNHSANKSKMILIFERQDHFRFQVNKHHFQTILINDMAFVNNCDEYFDITPYYHVLIQLNVTDLQIR